MPVQPVISLEQIVIIVAFLMMLIALMWFLRRHRRGITSRIHADRRMQHIEDLSLAPQQRLHLIEVDGRTFLVHAGKGHAASFIAVGGDTAGPDTAGADTAGADTAGADTAAPAARSASKSAAPRGQSKSSTKKPAPAAKPKSAFAAAIAQARRNNPSLEFGK